MRRIWLVAQMLFLVACGSGSRGTEIGTAARPGPEAVNTKSPVVAPPPRPNLPGEFVIRTFNTNTYLSARDGDQTMLDPVITTATSLGSEGYERFRLSDLPPSATTIQTHGGHYLSASGGIKPGNGDPRRALQTYVTNPDNIGTAFFHLIVSILPPHGHTNISRSWPGYFTIQTSSGMYLTAVGGGGQSSGAFHTDLADPKKVSAWEHYWILKCGDLGSGYRYAFRPTGTGPMGKPFQGYILAQLDLNDSTHHDPKVYMGVYATSFQLTTQSDGSYAMGMPTKEKTYYLTAVGGGGLASGNNLHTDATQVQAWEHFRIVDQGDCTYTIQTSAGWYIASGPKGVISTRISDPNAAPSIGYNAKWELIMEHR